MKLMTDESDTMDKLVFFAVLISLGACQLFNDCPGVSGHDNSYYLKAFGDSCFEFILFRQRLHAEAKEECETHGGHLALVKSQAIQDFIVHTLTHELRNYPYSKLWIGLNDIDKEGEYKWEDGTPLNYSNWASYEGPGTISASHDVRDCVVMSPGYHFEWQEIACEQTVFLYMGTYETHNYICQYALVPPGRR